MDRGKDINGNGGINGVGQGRAVLVAYPLSILPPRIRYFYLESFYFFGGFLGRRSFVDELPVFAFLSLRALLPRVGFLVLEESPVAGRGGSVEYEVSAEPSTIVMWLLQR